MSANGEIEIAVTAEGADDAAAELAGEGGDGGGPPVGGGDTGEGGLSGNLRAGAIAGVLLSALGPILDVLSPILKILQAFLAPVASLLLRLFAPVLRFLIRLLPAWMAFINELPGFVADAVDFLMSLPGRLWGFISDLPNMIWRAIKSGAGWLTDGAVAIAEGVWGQFSSWASRVVELLRGVVDGVGGTIATGAAIVDPRQGFRIREIPINTPFTGRRQETPREAFADASQAERRFARERLIELGFDAPEFLKVQERDSRTETP